MLKHYVRHVSAVVERFKKVSWRFEPAVPLDQLSDEEKTQAAKLYSNVSEADAENIETLVATDLS